MLNVMFAIGIGAVLTGLVLLAAGHYKSAFVAFAVGAAILTRGRSIRAKELAKRDELLLPSPKQPHNWFDVRVSGDPNRAIKRPVTIARETIEEILGKKTPTILLPPVLLERQTRAQEAINEAIAAHPVAGPVAVEAFRFTLQTMTGPLEPAQPPAVRLALEQLILLFGGASR